MALPPQFPTSPSAPLIPEQRWFGKLGRASSQAGSSGTSPHRGDDARTLSVELTDTFGNDTMALVPVTGG